MCNKNYLTKQEQNIWKYIKEKEILDNELIKQIFPEMQAKTRNKILHNLYKKGFLNRARKDLYYNLEKLKNFYKLAMEIKMGYIGLNSALKYYNLIEYEDFTIFIMTKDFQKKILLGRTQYNIQFIPLKKRFIGYEKKDDFNISSIEKTMFDCLLKPKYVGFQNITKAIYEANIDWNKFISFFKLTNNSSLCQRTGYILDLMEKITKKKIPSSVYDYLQKQVKNPVKLMAIKGKSTFNKKWKIQDNLGKKNILSWWY
ncbi:MAG: hypothetical protein ABIG89_00390 [Candidatus Woesearchaeota archaeon]